MYIKKILSKWYILLISALLLLFASSICFGASFCVSNSTELQTALTTAASNGEDDTIQIVRGVIQGISFMLLMSRTV